MYVRGSYYCNMIAIIRGMWGVVITMYQYTYINVLLE